MMFLDDLPKTLAFRFGSGNEFSLRLSRRVDPLWPVVPGREILDGKIISEWRLFKSWEDVEWFQRGLIVHV